GDGGALGEGGRDGQSCGEGEGEEDQPLATFHGGTPKADGERGARVGCLLRGWASCSTLSRRGMNLKGPLAAIRPVGQAARLPIFIRQDRQASRLPYDGAWRILRAALSHRSEGPS